MAKLDLIPDVSIMLIQGAVFASALYVVKKNFVEPYLKLKDKRDSATTGQQSEAHKSIIECEEKTLIIEEKIKAALLEAKNIKQNIRETALKNQKSIVDQASKEAKEETAKISQKIKEELKTEKAKLSSVITDISNELYSKAIN